MFHKQGQPEKLIGLIEKKSKSEKDKKKKKAKKESTLKVYEV